MMLEEVIPGQRLTGIVAQPVEVLSVQWLGAGYLQVTYQSAAGVTAEALLDRALEAHLEVERETGLATDGDAVRDWKLAVEALRIRHAGLIDPMLAVSSSSLRPLPHQIKAVYGELLPRTPLRYLLADDPGAGKTIMCGLYVKELILRGDLDRCLIVAPGGLVDQWVEELWEKVGLQFRVLTRELISTTVGASVFDDNPRLIARMDMLARNEELHDLLARSEWDLVVVDEAHRMSARRAGQEMDTTKRYDLGRLLGEVTRNLLLMTATPHSGDPAAFQAFLALLDEDRFAGRRSHGQIPTTDVMRRMLKEELLTMDGKPLFPERRASTVRYELSGAEQDLYEAVSEYVRHEMNRAEALRRQGDRRGHTIGFALTVLQRRLASSPEAILRSLERRRERLSRLRTELLASDEESVAQASELSRVSVPRSLDADDADQDQAAIEEVENAVADAASAAQSAAELAFEIEALDALVDVAAEVRRSAQDSKWLQLRSILGEHELARHEDGSHRKIIIFSEHRDTLRYLTERIREMPGRADAVVEIHGGMSRTQRLDVRRRFSSDKGVSVLVATDAAGEGLNLQCAHLMVNYDLPWNPNRIEQRFGRIHRIGQTEVCHLWNLVADGTREGDVFSRLLDKMQEQSKAFQGKVFDVLGEAFEGAPLRDLLVKAVRYGDDPEVRRQLDTVIDERVGRGIPELVERRAMYAEVLQRVDLDQARRRADVGARTRIQPHFTSSWFESALQQLGGRSRRRADGTVEVAYLPDDIRSIGRSRGGAPLKSRYERVDFDPDGVAPDDGQPAELVVPGHPLLDSMAEATELKLERALRDGVVLVDESGHGDEPRAFVAVLHEVVDGHSKPRTLSRRVSFVEVDADGGSRDAGPSYLDYRPLGSHEVGALSIVMDGSFASGDLSDIGLSWAMQHVVPEHVSSVRGTHAVAVERAKADVVERLGQELQHWKGRSVRGDGDNVHKAQRRVEELEGRLAKRLSDLEADGQVVARPPRVLATALVVPAGKLGAAAESQDQSAVDARQLVADAEAALGRDVHLDGGPHTIRSVGADGASRWTDVVTEPINGRATRFTRTQVMHARNLGSRYRLALVKQAHTGTPDVRYVSDPFKRVRLGAIEQHSVDIPWSTLWRQAEVVS